MVKGKEIYQKELINTYIKWQNTEKTNKSRSMQAIARDNMRKIKKFFEQNFHEDIEKYLGGN
jgi:hypothetical protein